ncbi:hypothetical protein ACIA8E_24210 [Streptomyces sp. NPDC051664]
MPKDITFEGHKRESGADFASRQYGVNKAVIYEYRQQMARRQRIPKVIDG